MSTRPRMRRVRRPAVVLLAVLLLSVTALASAAAAHDPPVSGNSMSTTEHTADEMHVIGNLRQNRTACVAHQTSHGQTAQQAAVACRAPFPDSTALPLSLCAAERAAADAASAAYQLNPTTETAAAARQAQWAARPCMLEWWRQQP